jgi:hypothetical protein
VILREQKFLLIVLNEEFLELASSSGSAQPSSEYFLDSYCSADTVRCRKVIISAHLVPSVESLDPS